MHRRHSVVSGSLLALIAMLAVGTATEAAAPVIDGFVASPAVPVPGQIVRLTLNAHDPDCASTCSTGCGTYIRSDLLAWSDDSGRAASPFASSTPAASGSPWSATVDWTAPPTDGTYTVTAQVSDSGGMVCNGRQTTMATLTITVSSVRAPVIDAFDVTPATVNASGVAMLSVVAHDPDSRPLTYEFSADAGTIQHASASDATAQWIAPPNAGVVAIRCRVTAPGAPAVTAQRNVNVTIGSYSGAIVLPGFTATRARALPDDRIAMIDGRTGTLKLASRSETVHWTRTGLREPVGIALLANDLWILERRARSISRWSTTGTRKATVPVAGVSPSDVAGNDSLNELAVADTGSGRVLILDPSTGGVKRTVGDGVLISPTGVWYAGADLAVADSAVNRIIVFNQAGSLVRSLGDDTLFVRPQSIGRDDSDGTWLVSDSFSGEIHVMDSAGLLRGSLGGYGDADGQLVNPVDVAFMPNSRQVVVSTLTRGIRFYSLVSTLPRPLAASAVTAADRRGDNGGSVQVSWVRSPDDPARVTGYWVERDNGGDGVYTRLGLLPAGSVSYLDSKAAVGGCHVYRIVATTGLTESPSGSSGCVASINDLAPDAPGVLSASPATPRTVDLQWSRVAAEDLAAYALEIQWPGGVRSLTLSPFETKAAVAGLEPDVEYLVSIRAVDTASNLSAPSQARVRTWPDEAPPAPSLVSVSDTGDGGELSVTWDIPEGRVPVGYYTVELVPQQPGWPSKSFKTSARGRTASGLVNEIAYVATVRAFTPWDRAGDARSSAAAAPSTPVQNIPILKRAGRVGTQGFEDSAGVAVHVPFGEDARRLKFLYRAVGTPLVVQWNGKAQGELLADTGGEWMEGEVVLDRAPSGESRLDLRSYAFPSPTAELAVSNLDLVPLPPGEPSTESLETVIDVRWVWRDSRRDLKVQLFRTDVPARTRGTIPGDRRPATWETVPCLMPASGVCRDPFVELSALRSYGLTISSPAGWSSEPAWLHGESRPTGAVAPVTDLVANQVSGEWRLAWTPISFYSEKSRAIEAVRTYRVYKTDGVATVLLGEVDAPPVRLPRSVLDSERETFVVRAVDDEGSESQ